MITNFNNKEFWLDELKSNSNQIEFFVEQAKSSDRLAASRLIVNILRNYLEAIIAYVSISDGAEYTDVSRHQAIIEKSLSFVRGKRKKYEVLVSLHELINKSASHESVLVGDYAERLMLSYIPKLIRIKKFLSENYSINTVRNLLQFPLKLDDSTTEFYLKIIDVLKRNDSYGIAVKNENYYILDKKEKYINGYLFFEYTLSVVDDNRNKADRIIAFSNVDIFDNYATKVFSYDKKIKVFGIETTIKIIYDYNVAIRGCEFKKLSAIIGVDANGFTYTEEYYRLMKYIKDKRMSLADFVRLKKAEFERELSLVCYSERQTILKKILQVSRAHVINAKKGTNVLLYLLASMENQMLQKQSINFGEKQLQFSDLMLNTKTAPFDRTPFCANLVGASVDPKILFSTFDIKDHEFELVKRELDCFSNANGLLYCPDDIFDGDTELVSKVNKLKSITNNYPPFCIEFAYDSKNKRYLYILENEEVLVSIFTTIGKYMTKETILDYKNFISNSLSNSNVEINDKKKRDALLEMFNNKSAFAVYGPAGTGKSYLAKLTLSLITNYSVLCISSTHASLQNLKRRIGSNAGAFATVEKVVKDTKGYFSKFDFVIIDECSTISNSDMYYILKNISPKLLLLMGDTYQIESIAFGNWFNLLQCFIPNNAYTILDNCFRTDETILKDLWALVREIKPGVHEYLKNYCISKPLNNSFFNNEFSDHKVILCLNYGGLFGINNINTMMQSKNKGKEILFREHIYKVDDPILFKESSYHNEVLYNNLKGRIIGIEEDANKVSFSVVVEDNINVDSTNGSYRDVRHIDKETQLTFDVYKCSDKEIAEGVRPFMVVPFNVAYATSIHKAQGLEFDKVDVLIADEIKETVTHNIFYTAITRAVKELNIYWSPQCEQRVVDNFCAKNYKTDEFLLNKKYPHLKFKRN